MVRENVLVVTGESTEEAPREVDVNLQVNIFFISSEFDGHSG